jgi:hypothetical protein
VDANATLDRLNRALAELGMPAAALALTSGLTGAGMAFGVPAAVVRLVHAEDPEVAYGEIRIPFDIGGRDV